MIKKKKEQVERKYDKINLLGATITFLSIPLGLFGLTKFDSYGVYIVILSTVLFFGGVCLADTK